MAVATPVYESDKAKDIYTNTTYTDINYNGRMTEDERHNASAGNMLEKILNPENKLSDIMSAIHGQPEVQEQPAIQQQPAMQQPSVPQQQAAQPVSQPRNAGYATPATNTNNAQPVYLVQGARADSDIFRADSEFNKAYLAQKFGNANVQQDTTAYNNPGYAPAYVPEYVQTVQQASITEEEETDDQKPTRTTTQYRTLDANGSRVSEGILNAYREGEISRPEESEETHSKITFTKRDKIIFGVVIGLIVAVFVLIIVNSAVISSINADLAALDGQLVNAQQQLEESLEELDGVTSYDNVYQYAIENGIID